MSNSQRSSISTREWQVQVSRLEDRIRTYEDAIRQRDRLNEKLKRSRERYRELFDNASDIIFTADAHGNLTSANNAALRTWGYEIEQMLELSVRDIVAADYVEPLFDVARRALENDDAANAPIEVLTRTAEGRSVWLEVSVRGMADRGPYAGVHCIARDITERKVAQEQTRYQALHDQLTGLPNRGLFADRLRVAIADAQRRSEFLGVFYLDLDRFKPINDSLGHQVGDVLLTLVAQRLLTCVREGDTVSRRGGDEFTIIFNHLSRLDDAAMLARRLVDAFAQPFECLGHRLYVTPSIGIAAFPNDGKDVETLLNCADIAMYRAKSDGRNTFQFFQESMRTRVVERRETEDLLRLALRAEAFQVYYQPRVDAMGHVSAVEALLRLPAGSRGLLVAESFLGVAEESGLIGPIGSWVLDQAVGQAQRWRDEGREITMVVNATMRELLFGDLTSRVALLLARHGLPPSCLQVELSDNQRARNLADVNAAMERLAGLGVRVGLDGFGSAHSGFAHLQNPALRVVNPARSLIASALANGRDATILRGIVQLVAHLGLDVGAIGIESSDQLAVLRDAGFTHFQGFHFGVPAPANEVEFAKDTGAKHLTIPHAP